MGRVIPVGLAVEVDSAASVSWQKTRECYDKHPVWVVAQVILTAGPPFLGLWLAGWTGVFAGLALSLVCALVGLRAITRVREIERGGA